MSLAAPRRGLPGGGFLRMVPDDDDSRPAVTSPPKAPEAVPAFAPPPASYGVCRSPTASPFRPDSNFQVRPRTGAVFQVGAGDTSTCPTPSTGGGSPAPFDVRASFAPMPRYGKQPAVRRDVAPATSRKRSAYVETAYVSNGAPEKIDSDDDGQGIEYAGRRWKGKTAHAVEQEMEELGDRTVMSYAPDAVYLASRLEGLKRNLEANDWERKPRYLIFEEEEEQDKGGMIQKEAGTSEVPAAHGSTLPHALPVSVPKVPGVADPHEHLPLADTVDEDDDDADSITAELSPPQELDVDLDLDLDTEKRLQEEDVAGSDAPVSSVGHATWKYAQLSSALSEGDADSKDGQTIRPGQSTRAGSMAGVQLHVPPRIDPVAKQAALDARVDVRSLRRPDLEQVRELHCLHGDQDLKVDFDTYTTSAGFLIRLLVDEKHVCLVAVARPLPEPAPLPTQLMPSCPPPSLDMPPSGGQYLLAGRGIAGASPYLTGITNRTLATPKRFDLNTGWHSPGASGPPSTSGLSRDDASGSTSTPPDSLFGTSPRDAPAFVSTSLKGPSKLSGILSPRRRSGAANGNSGSRLQQTSVPARELRSCTASQDQSSSELQTAPTSLDSHSPPEEPRRGFKTVLAGPTNSVAPPRAVRVMAAPPPGGLFNTDAETILGVASAKISTKAVPPSYAGGDLWPGIDSAPAQVMPHLEAHVLTLAVAHSERGQGLGARLLDALLKEAKAKAVALAAKPRRRGSNQNRSAPTTEQLMAEPMHTTLEVHPANSGALALFQSRQFHRVEGARGTLPRYFQGDWRIPLEERQKIGGTDAWVLERHAP